MKGRPLAKAGYEQELTSIKGFVALQNRADSGGASMSSDKVSGGHMHSSIVDVYIHKYDVYTGQYDTYVYAYIFPPGSLKSMYRLTGYVY